jgi:hypothetical protein
MNMKILAVALFTLLIATVDAFAAEGKVTISSPANGATFGSNDNITLKYEAVPGPNGDHLHLNVDGKRVDVIHALKGSADVGTLPAGQHHICLAVNTSGHTPTGVEGCIDVTVK